MASGGFFVLWRYLLDTRKRWLHRSRILHDIRVNIVDAGVVQLSDGIDARVECTTIKC